MCTVQMMSFKGCNLSFYGRKSSPVICNSSTSTRVWLERVGGNTDVIRLHLISFMNNCKLNYHSPCTYM